MSHKKDTDYLAISTRVHAMENRMLSRERMDRMIDAKDDGEALKVLSECGYGGEGLTLSNVEAALAAAGQETFRDLLSSVPDPKVVQVFQLRYDYHNAKALVKAQAVGKDARHLLMSGGRYAPQKLADELRVAGVELPSKLYDVKALADELAGAYRAAVEASEAPHA